ESFFGTTNGPTYCPAAQPSIGQGHDRWPWSVPLGRVPYSWTFQNKSGCCPCGHSPVCPPCPCRAHRRHRVQKPSTLGTCSKSAHGIQINKLKKPCSKAWLKVMNLILNFNPHLQAGALGDHHHPLPWPLYGTASHLLQCPPGCRKTSTS